uniref:Uncharacterized protein n=1 Tax=Micrurus corallinus TaxID=54390 RepID=A0A2D4FD48_MICCO
MRSIFKKRPKLEVLLKTYKAEKIFLQNRQFGRSKSSINSTCEASHAISLNQGGLIKRPPTCWAPGTGSTERGFSVACHGPVPFHGLGDGDPWTNRFIDTVWQVMNLRTHLGLLRPPLSHKILVSSFAIV